MKKFKKEHGKDVPNSLSPARREQRRLKKEAKRRLEQPSGGSAASTLKRCKTAAAAAGGPAASAPQKSKITAALPPIVDLQFTPDIRFPTTTSQSSFLIVDFDTKTLYAYFASPNCWRWTTIYGMAFANLKLAAGWTKGALISKHAAKTSALLLQPSIAAMTSDDDRNMFSMKVEKSTLNSAVTVTFENGAPPSMMAAALPLAQVLRRRGFDVASLTTEKGEVAQVASCLGGAKLISVAVKLTDSVSIIAGPHDGLMKWMQAPLSP